MCNVFKCILKIMDSKDNKIDVDPDYIRNNTAVRNIIKKEDEESKVGTGKICNILAEEFDKELSTRQNQLEEIEEKIAKAQKLLHILRYVLITSYYNKNLEYNVKETEAETSALGAQNRIHPAIKKLLGSNASLNVFSNLGKRKAVQKNCDKNEASTSQGSAPKKMKSEPKLIKSKVQGIDSNQNCLKNRKKTQHRIIIGNISKYMPSLDNDNTTHKWMVYVRGDKDKPDISNIVEKVKFYLHPSYKPHDVIEIGEPPFHLTRRGWGEFPLRVRIIFKCKLNKPVEVVHNLKLDKTCSGRQVLGNETLVGVFLHEEIPQASYLEPSTSQNIMSQYLVEPVTDNDESLHTEIHIKNEPEDEVDLFLSSTESFLEDSYSPLELDFEGSRELNSDTKDLFRKSLETNVNIFKKPLVPDLDRQHQHQNQKSLGSNSGPKYSYSKYEELGVNSSEINLEKPGLDHDYCQEGDMVLTTATINEKPVCPHSSILEYSFNDEHSYCRPQADSNEDDRTYVEQPQIEVVHNNNHQDDNKLRFGLDESYFDNSSIGSKNSRKTHSFVLNKSIKVLLQTNNQTILTNGHLVTLSPKKTTARIVSVLPSANVYRIPQNKFRNMGEVLPYLMHRFPLWTCRAEDPMYKRAFPYVATSKEQYDSWNIGKRINAEWNRAKVLQRVLSSESLPDVEKWTVKTYFMYSRSHLYSPAVGLSIFKKHSIEVSLINSCFANTFSPSNRKRDFPIHNEEAVDIESEQGDSLSNLQSNIIDISDPTLKPQCSFIKEIALDSGIVLKPEEIIEGVVFNGAERMILEAVKCFAEGLIRRAHHYSVCSGSYRPNVTEVTTMDIKLALSERSELKSLEDFRKKRQAMFYFS